MELIKIDIKEFKNKIYPEYEKLFPDLERKSYKRLKDTYENGIVDIFEIYVEENIVGFILANHLDNNPYIQLDYFAIFEKYQNKGYGSNAIKLLKEVYKEYEGIFIEIEKVGLGKSEVENSIREKRAKFYENLGFNKLNFELNLFTVIYTAYILPCNKNIFHNESIEKDIFDFYIAVLGKSRANKYCKVII